RSEYQQARWPLRFIGYLRRSSYPVNPRTVATETSAPGATDETTISLQRSIYDPGYVNAMSHFYRGELGRIMVWRQRLDITTNWAITSSTRSEEHTSELQSPCKLVCRLL